MCVVESRQVRNHRCSSNIASESRHSTRVRRPRYLDTRNVILAAVVNIDGCLLEGLALKEGENGKSKTKDPSQTPVETKS